MRFDKMTVKRQEAFASAQGSAAVGWVESAGSTHLFFSRHIPAGRVVRKVGWILVEEAPKKAYKFVRGRYPSEQNIAKS